MSAPLSNIAIPVLAHVPQPPRIREHLRVCKTEGSILLHEGFRGGGAGRRCHQKEVWSWAEDKVQEPSQNLGSTESRSRAHWSPSRGWDGELVAAWGSHCYPNSAGYEAGVVGQGKVGCGHQGKGMSPFLAASMGSCLNPCPNSPAPRG